MILAISFDTVYCSDRIEMDARNSVFHQLLALSHAPFNTHLFGFRIILAFQCFFHQIFR